MNKGQQALNTLREKGYTNHFQPITLEQQYPNEFKTLQELVDKATPKKVSLIELHHVDLIINRIKCPQCSMYIYGINHISVINFCNQCGQALDWSDKDDK